VDVKYVRIAVMHELEWAVLMNAWNLKSFYCIRLKLGDGWTELSGLGNVAD